MASADVEYDQTTTIQPLGDAASAVGDDYSYSYDDDGDYEYDYSQLNAEVELENDEFDALDERQDEERDRSLQKSLDINLYIGQNTITDADLFVPRIEPWTAKQNFIDTVVSKIYLMVPGMVVGVILGLVIWVVLLLVGKGFSTVRRRIFGGGKNTSNGFPRTDGGKNGAEAVQMPTIATISARDLEASPPVGPDYANRAYSREDRLNSRFSASPSDSPLDTSMEGSQDSGGAKSDSSNNGNRRI